MDVGCTQGSALGPGLWNVLYDTLLSLELPVGASLIGFADDTLVMIKGRNMKVIERIANDTLELIIEWGNAIKLEFNASKTQMMLISNKMSIAYPKIIMNNNILEYKDSIKYLGIIIDKRLNWNKHIENTISKATKLTFALSRISRNTWGQTSNQLKTIYLGELNL